MSTEVTRADMMTARDKVAQAWNAVQCADAAWNANPSEVTNSQQAAAAKSWKKAVKAREAMERRMWAQQDAA